MDMDDDMDVVWQFSPTISYILYGRKMRTVQQSITLFASFLLVLLLVLIVIWLWWYVRQNRIDNNWLYVNLHVKFIIMPVALVQPFPQGYLLCYYSKHIRIIGWWYWLFYVKVSNWYGWLGIVHRWQCNDHLWWHVLSNGNHTNNNITTISSSSFSDPAAAVASL